MPDNKEDSDHDHLPLKASLKELNPICRYCHLPIFFDGEWCIWITQDQLNVKIERYNNWLEELKQARIGTEL